MSKEKRSDKNKIIQTKTLGSEVNKFCGSIGFFNSKKEALDSRIPIEMIGRPI